MPLGINIVDPNNNPLGFSAVSKPSAIFGRPANTTAYSVGQLMANDTLAIAVTPMSWAVSRIPGLGGMVRRAKIRGSSNNTSNFVAKLHLFHSIPTIVTTGDGGAFASVVSGAASWIGSIDVTVSQGLSDGAVGTGISSDGGEINFTSDVIYGLIEMRAAYTPTSGETIAVTLEVLQN